ncbi:type I-C CRISPR-associated endonuclease Cas1c [Psychromonas antarctica]|uniref:type I-C CRISPR-associated endonuclease Cas1c n=1 Tax=Psychromonas antarctica TaxID=67573 RepID=UPI001EE9184E|nr:type I-C CRISPR-associated endonuclease Cas1c [Psychromonas antarctica]MCG6201144.1 type I-C CRISPR-associated endonuclease Cas1c [Psychromonas antarctica]
MKKLQNSLYLTKDKLYVHKEREAIVIKQDKETLLKIPIHSISNIFCFGQCTVSPALMAHCAKHNVNLAYFDLFGRYQARIQGRQSGNVLLRRAQYRRSDNDPIDIARVMVAAKIQNYRSLLQRQIRNNGENEPVQLVIKTLKFSIEQVKNSKSVDSIRGFEGDAAAQYFSVFQHLVKVSLQSTFVFTGRNKRPPKDPINAMLSLLYSVIGQDISGALQAVGLDPQIGFLHADRPGRDSLAQDVIEEFRAYLGDRLVLSLINRQQIKITDFETESSGAVRLKDDARKTLFSALQQRKQEVIIHPFLQEKVEIGLLPHIQAMLLARHLRSDLEYYPPFLSR